MKKATVFDLQVDIPLAWDLFDFKGNLLLRAGHVLSMPQYVHRLIERGAYIRAEDYEARPPSIVQQQRKMAAAAAAPPPAPRELPVFMEAAELLDQTRRLNRAVAVPAEQANLCARIRDLAERLIHAHDLHGDALSAALHLARETRDYRPNHQLLSSFLALRISQPLALDASQRRSLACAALSRDLGLLPVDAECATNPQAADSERVRAAREVHPLMSLRLLSAAGCNDADWLAAVEHHHERMDGGGFPAGRQAEEIPLFARIVAVADAYAEQVVPDGLRQPTLCGNALRDIFTRQAHYDTSLAATLYKSLTRFPPGTAVRLESGEIAVVRRAEPLTLFSLFTQDGMPRLKPLEVAGHEPGARIVEAVHPEAYRAFPTIARKLWD